MLNNNIIMPKLLKSLTVKELKSKAKKSGIKRYSYMSKNQLISSIKRSSKRSSKSSGRGLKRVDEVYKGKPGNPLNKFFDRIFIINLEDMTKRFKIVSKQFKKHGIKYSRFNAINGRCKDDECEKKRKLFEQKYGYKISKKVNTPTASLVLGTIQILKEQIRNKWKWVLIAEDDINFKSTTLRRFKEGIKDLPYGTNMIYLGCGNMCGTKDISDDKNSRNKYKTSLSIVSDEYDWYVHYKDDLRTPCDENDCYRIDNSKYLSYPSAPGGTWLYAISLSGAKKFLKFLNGRISDHIDQLYIKAVQKGIMKPVAFDPPIVTHIKGAFRADSTIPWSW
jgi:GR25 family glycosyltransferase involved in LPS biosynthesis